MIEVEEMTDKLDTNKTFTVRGKAYYAKVMKPQGSKQYPDKPPSFGITVYDMDKNSQESLKANLKAYKVKKQIKLHEDDDLTGKESFTFERRAFTDESGEVANYPTVVDKYADPMPRNVLIGNGSDVLVSYRMRPFTERGTGKTRHAATLTGVQVVKLIPYSKEENVFKPLEEKPENDADEALFDPNQNGYDSEEDEEVPF